MIQINTPEIYKHHIAECVTEIKILEKKLMSIRVSKDYLVGLIKPYENIINQVCNSTFEELVTTNHLGYVYRLDFNLSKINLVESEFNPSNVKRLINNIINTNKIIIETKERIIFLQNSSTNYEVYKRILDYFNVRIVDKILEGYSFDLGHHLSEIRIRKKERKKANIDWEHSNQLRARLIEQGKVPFHKKDAPNGEKWFVYFTSDVEHWWYWAKPRRWFPKEANGNFNFYSFIPSKGYGGATSKLRSCMKTNPFAHLNFSE